MSKILACPKCGYSNSPSAKFCSQCATSLIEKTKSCYNCGAPNKLDAVYCQNCATELVTVPPGFTIQRAKEWKVIFEQLGWINESDLLFERVLKMTKDALDKNQIELIPPSDEMEPWIFPLLAAGSKQGLRGSEGSALHITAINGTKTSSHNTVYILATRCRIRCIIGTWKMGLTKPNFIEAKVTDFWYKDITNYNWKIDGKRAVYSFKTNQGTSLEWSSEFVKRSFLHISNLLFGNDSFSRLKSYEVLAQQAEDVGKLASIVGMFLEEISEVFSTL